MLITRSQQYTFWREWNAIVRAHGWDRHEAETQRKAMLDRAGFTSLTQVTRVDGFTAVLKEIAALKDDLNGMLRADENPRRVLVHKCRELADEPYIVALAASDRFKTNDWPALPLDQLTQLRNTLADRAVGQHRNSTLARRRATNRSRRAAAPTPARATFPAKDFPGNSLDSEEQFADQVEFQPETEAQLENEPF